MGEDMGLITVALAFLKIRAFVTQLPRFIIRTTILVIYDIIKLISNEFTIATSTSISALFINFIILSLERLLNSLYTYCIFELIPKF